MSLLENTTSMGHLIESVYHFNHALDLEASNSSKVEVAHATFNGLNKLQTHWRMKHPDQKLGEVKAFKTMILSVLSSEAKDDLLRSDQMRNLVALDPKIMDHSILTRKNYIPDEGISPSLSKKATEEHKKVNTAYRDYLEHMSENKLRERVIEHVAELLYIVRSNIDHGEKTPFGPDLAKKERDEKVCMCIVPLEEMLLDMLLDKPSQKLISYGTLGPGKANHSLVSDLKGRWQECFIHGILEKNQGLPQFSWDPARSKQKGSLFISEDLPSNWDRIDKFEGAKYKRRLVPTETGTNIAIAYAYVAV